MAIQIKIRRDTKAEWDSADPVLLAGELGFELKDSATSGRFKIGNGSREWSRLPFWYAYQDSAGAYGSSGGSAGITWGGDRGLIAGRYSTTSHDIIDYIDITTPGNATDFGDLTSVRYGAGLASNASTVLIAGGYVSAGESQGRKDLIEYVSPATTGNATAWTGVLTAARDQLKALSDGTYGVFCMGWVSAPNVTMDYVTIATDANAVDFGDTTLGRAGPACASDATRGIIAGGYQASGDLGVNIIEYITVASPSNSTDFGDLTVARNNLGGAGDGTYATFAGGASQWSGTKYNIIDYITVQTTANATDFGDLTQTVWQTTASGNSTRAFSAGGRSDATNYETTMEYWTFATPGNASDFGDLTQGGWEPSASSGNAS